MRDDDGLGELHSTLAARSTSCVVQTPSYTTTSFSGTCSATQRPKLRSGVKRILSLSRLRTTETALAEVQQMSDSAFTSAVELTYVTTV